ncbi:MAG TPA: hypothetical protein VNL70_07130 [Tepidisphaeraceae bacterium]|nr:hypothetical protein [Tepidisphaeraceae bacterium]
MTHIHPSSGRSGRQLWISTTIAMLMALCAQPAGAINRVWNRTGGTGSWSNGANWSPAGTPQSGDDVFVTATNPNANVVIFDIDDSPIATSHDPGSPFVRNYNSILINQSGAGTIAILQQQFTLSAELLTISLGGPGEYSLLGGRGRFSNGTLNAQGTLTVAAGASIACTNFTQNGGTLTLGGFFSGGNFTHGAGRITSTGTMNFSGTYAAYGGTFTGVGSSVGIVNAGTFINNVGTFVGHVNAGRLIVNGNGTFLGNVTNRSSLNIPSSQTIFTDADYTQIGGTVTQAGFVGGAAPGGLSSSVPTVNMGGGATWIQTAGRLQGSSLLVGSGNNGAATYSISGSGSANFGGVGVGALSDGSINQSGGLVQATALTLGGFAGLVRGAPVQGQGQRGYYQLSGGTLSVGGLTLAPQDALLGMFVQTGGVAQIGQLQSNLAAASSGIISISGGTFGVASNSISSGSIIQTGGTVRFNDFLDGAGTISVSGNGSFTAERIRHNALLIGGDAQVAIANVGFSTIATSKTTSRIRQLRFEQVGSTIRGSLDVGQNRLVIDYDSGASPAADIRRYLASGLASGNWNGPGIRSAAAAFDSSRMTGLGYAEASDMFGPSGGVFEDIFVDDTALLIKYTYYGDADLSGSIDATDYSLIDNGYVNRLVGWTSGDFDYSGFIDATDYALIDNAYVNQNPALGQAMIAEHTKLFGGAYVAALRAIRAGVIPEPATAASLTLCTWALRRHRRLVGAPPRRGCEA